MTVLLPGLVFLAVFAIVLVASRRQNQTVAQINRHLIVPMGAAAAATPRSRTQILGLGGRAGLAGQWATRITRPQRKRRSAQLLKEADSTMPLATYLVIRVVFAFVLTPVFVLLVLNGLGLTLFGIAAMVIGGFTVPNLPSLRLKRRARKRARAIEMAMPDALDLMVVCSEGGLSLDGAIQQVSNRTQGVLANDLRRLLQEIGSGLPRRDALQSLGERSQSESLKIFCATIIQADRMGMSIAMTLRTLADTMRTRRRQAAETQARKAPIKMMPFLVIFMIPALFIVILGPAVANIIQFMRDVSKM